MRRLAGFARTAPLVSIGAGGAVTLVAAAVTGALIGAAVGGAAVAILGLAAFKTYENRQRKQRRMND